MTQTIQYRSLAVLNEPGTNSSKNKHETEDNARLLLMVYDNLNELYERLNRLSNIIGRKHNLNRKG